LLTPAEEVLQNLQLEIELQGLSNVERMKRIALLRAETDASTENGQAISDAIDQIAANEDQIRAMDAFRDSASDLFVDIADGSKSAKDAFGDFMDSLRTRILRMLAEKLIEKLFGAFGSTGGGSSGEGFAGFFASIFGEGRAGGGTLVPGKLHEVNELGKPELLNVGKKQFIMGTPNSNVVPIDKARGSNTSNTNITVNLPPSIRRDTANQVAVATAITLRKERARNA
jgi:hypothetical protein